MKQARYLTLLVAGLFCGVSAVAGDAGRQSPLSIGAGARGIGMGGGSTALGGNASAVYYNPAGLSLLEYQEFSIQHTLLAENTVYDFGAWVYPISEKHGLGIGYMRIGTDNIVRRVDFQDVGTFDYAESQLMICYGQRFTWLSTGVTLKIVNESIDNLSDYGVGMGIGLIAKLGGPVRLGGIVRDAMPARIQLSDISQKVPQTFAAGVAVDRWRLTPQTALTATCDLEGSDGRSAKLHAGGEALFYDAYAFRAGYDRNNLTVGAGVHRGRLAIDYAYKMQSDLADQHTFSLSFFIGPSVADQIKRREAPRHAEPVIDPRVIYINALKDTANGFMHQFRLDSALVYFQKLYALEPSSQEYLGTIAAIENAQRVQQEQEDKLRAAQQEQEQFLRSYYDQARAFYDKKYYSAATDLLKLILDIQPENPQALVLREEIVGSIAADITRYAEAGKQAEAQGNRIETIEACDRVLDLDSTNQWARQTRERALSGMDIAKHLNIGIDLFNKGQVAEAAKRFRSVLEARPNDVVAREYLAKIDTAASHTATLEDLQQDRAIWQSYIDGLRHMRDKEYQKAIDAWQKVLQAYPNQPNTLNNIEQARLRLKTEKTGR